LITDIVPHQSRASISPLPPNFSAKTHYRSSIEQRSQRHRKELSHGVRREPNTVIAQRPGTSSPNANTFAASRLNTVRTGPYGKALGNAFGLEDAPALKVRALRKADIYATEIHSTKPQGLTHELPREDAYLIGLMLRDFPHHEFYEDGRQAPLCDLKAGQTVLVDLKRSPVCNAFDDVSGQANIGKPFHSINLYVPRAAFDAIADDVSAPRIGDLHYVPGAGISDSTILSLWESMQAAFVHPERASQLFAGHVMMAMATHVAQTYGGLKPASQPPRGGLAPWQVRRAKEILDANLDGRVTVEQIAKECGLSVAHFTRAFGESTGMPPHRWQIRRRVEVAKSLLLNEKLSLSEVAMACGFADQSHFTRVFTRDVGISPGAWRRCLKS
jgi:AraC family transcriptional regulator